MNINTLTIKAQEALQAAFSLAGAGGNQAVEPLHILAALLSEEDSLAAFAVRAALTPVEPETFLIAETISDTCAPAEKSN